MMVDFENEPKIGEIDSSVHIDEEEKNAALPPIRSELQFLSFIDLAWRDRDECYEAEYQATK